MGFRPAKSVGHLPQPVAAPNRPHSTTLRAFGLLELIASAEEPPSLEELTRGSGLPKPTVYRILQLLIRGELVEREISAKRYAAGRRLGELSFALQMHSPSRRERHGILARLVDEIGETCNFTMLDGNEVVYVDRVETTAVVRLHMRIGSRVPLHCTASGKLFLAQLPPASVRRLVRAAPLRRYTERTITEPEALERELGKIRLSGIGTDVGEFLEGSVCLAVPVADPRGRVCAAVAVHGPAPRMSLRRGYTFLPAMRRAAGAIAATLLSAAKRPVERPLRRVV
ncbi:MAG TPA: IclR family transcriptional regulator [Casimicrobiaceae bacterium]|nr:IclR family transcriptional regulator [Casimicrobiaceae bacterium]